MSHARQTIREGAVTLLTGLTTTGTNVYDSRVYSFDVVPCLAVYSARDVVQDASQATLGDVVRRELTLTIEARSMPPEGGDTVEDQLDDICAEVETVIANNRTLGVGVQYAELTGTEIVLSGDLERPSGRAVLSCRVVYRIQAASPGTILA